MKIIRDEECYGLFMIPLFVDWGVLRCNVKDCAEKPSTIISGIENVPVFGLCEKHYQESNSKGELSYTLIFDDFDAFKETK